MCSGATLSAWSSWKGNGPGWGSKAGAGGDIEERLPGANGLRTRPAVLDVGGGSDGIDPPKMASLGGSGRSGRFDLFDRPLQRAIWASDSLVALGLLVSAKNLLEISDFLPVSSGLCGRSPASHRLFSGGGHQSSLSTEIAEVSVCLSDFTYVQEDQARKALCLVFVLAGLSAAYAVGQYYWFLEVNLLNRVRGFMSHWMTFGGQLMLASVALTAQLLFGRLQKARVPADANRSAPAIPICGSGPFRRVPWVTLLGLLLFALILTLTRSAWVGTTAGIFVLLAARNIRWTGLISGCVLVLFLLLPDSFQERVYSGFDLRDVTTRIRVELFLTGKNILRSHPWTGVGPRLVPKVYEEYKLSAEFPEWAYQHLHNDFIQIGADMGLIGLFTWSALWARVLWDLGMKMRSSQPGRNTDLTAAGLGAVIAFLCAGLFEYNFGDAEVLILLLFLITAPYVGKLPRQQAT